MGILPRMTTYGQQISTDRQAPDCGQTESDLAISLMDDLEI